MMDASALPFAEILAALSLATDLANNQPLESALRTCVVAVDLARADGASPEQLADVYYTSLLRFIGCTSYSHEAARAFGGDDNELHRTFAALDPRRLSDLLSTVSSIGQGQGIVGRARTLRSFAPEASRIFPQLAASTCDVAVRLTRRLGMSEGVTSALGQIYERWDGRGMPGVRHGDTISKTARVVQVARMIELHVRGSGLEEAREILQRRAGGQLDPNLVRIFLTDPALVIGALSASSVWEQVLERVPRTGAPIAASLDEIGEAFAEFVDLKSVYTLGHSSAVGRLAGGAGAALGMSERDSRHLRYAGLLHDLGQVAVPTGIWEKRGVLNDVEWERVRLHPYYTERVLGRSPFLAELAALTATHHERLDGSGYPHRVSALSRGSRILAAAECYESMLEERPHRAAMTSTAASDCLRAEAAEGKLDREAVGAVLEAAGHERARARKAWPAGLSDREVEVLRWVARGKSNKEIGGLLSISAKTVQGHVMHIYDKIGVSSRAGAALYAAEAELLRS
jgi:HD-GYP domain-containing protein (c-di-GMP phosphodiesterase class II)